MSPFPPLAELPDFLRGQSYVVIEAVLQAPPLDADDVLAVEQAREVLSHNSGRLRPPLNPQEFATVLWALHPDNQSETKVAEAFIIIRRKKHILCDAGPIVRKSPPLPPVPVRKTARRG